MSVSQVQRAISQWVSGKGLTAIFVLKVLGMSWHMLDQKMEESHGN
ncbi:TPA: hypothetical protein ACKPXT_000297 [Stenotrophomonas maltophilia]